MWGYHGGGEATFWRFVYYYLYITKIIISGSKWCMTRYPWLQLRIRVVGGVQYVYITFLCSTNHYKLFMAQGGAYFRSFSAFSAVIDYLQFNHPSPDTATSQETIPRYLLHSRTLCNNLYSVVPNPEPNGPLFRVIYSCLPAHQKDQKRSSKPIPPHPPKLGPERRGKVLEGGGIS